METIDDIKQKVILYLNKHQVNKAADWLRTLKLRQGSAPKSLARSLAYIAKRVFNLKTKLQLFEQALDLDRYNVFILTGYANTLTKDKQFKKALKIFERVLKINPNDVIALTGYGSALTDSGQSQKACEVFEKVLKKNRMILWR